MALTQVTADVIKNGTITSNKVDSSVAKIVTLTQAEYDALASYSFSTLYITTE
jgi:hypothetical protein